MPGCGRRVASLGLALDAGGLRRGGLGGCRVEQLTRPGDGVPALAVGEQAVMTDAVEARRQHVEEEAADELGGGEGHRLVAGATIGAVILPAEGDAFVVARNQPAVRDGDPVGIAGQVGEDGLRPGERALAVDEPLRLPQRCEKGGKGAVIGERRVAGEEDEPALRVRGGEPLQHQPAEQLREHANGQEEAPSAGDQCEGLWMPAGRDDGAGTSAGVRKPPGNEPAGRRATVGACGGRYGDLGGAEGLPGWA